MSSEKTIVTRVQLRYVIETSMPENSKMVIMTRGDAVAETSMSENMSRSGVMVAASTMRPRQFKRGDWRHVSEARGQSMFN